MSKTKTKTAKKRPLKLFQPGLFDGQERQEPAETTTAKVEKSAKTTKHPISRTRKSPTRRPVKRKPAKLTIPSLQQAIDQSDEVTGIAPECEIMPLNSDAKTTSLCESIRSAGQTNPIHLDSIGKLLNGRHRLIACCALGVKPEFKTVEPANKLMHVLADTNQREYNVAARASIALKVEVFLKKRCRELKDLPGSDILAGRRARKKNSIDTGGSQPTEVNEGETLRDAAIRLAGSTTSAVRRLVTVIKKDPELAEQAIAGQITLRKAEEALEQKSEEAGSNEPSASSPTTQFVGNDETASTVEQATVKKATKKPVCEATTVTKAIQDRGTSESPTPQSKSLHAAEIEELTLQNGKKEFWIGSRSAILIPERTYCKKTGVRVILDNGRELKILRCKSIKQADREIKRILNEDDRTR